MAITLELSAEAEALLHSKAAAKGVSVQKYVEDLVGEQPGESKPRPGNPQEMYGSLMAIAKKWHALPTLDHRTADEIIGYDQYGMPYK